MSKVVMNVLSDGLRGKAGSAVFVRTPSGTVVKPRTTPRNPRTNSQTAVRQNLARAVAAYRNLTPAEAAAWTAYAAGQVRVDLRDGTARRPSAYAAFTGLATKFQQVNPGAPIPLNPPPYAFIGDPITLTASGGAGQITFAASGPNSADVKTELLWQPLRFGHQSPQARAYRTQAFAHFETPTLDIALGAAPGWYALAYRFVNVQTGQETSLAVLGAVNVV
jgi:hypothetical protein